MSSLHTQLVNYRKHFKKMFPNASYDVNILSDKEILHKVKTYILHKRLPRTVLKKLSSAQIKYVNKVMKKRPLPPFLSDFLINYSKQVEIVGSFK